MSFPLLGKGIEMQGEFSANCIPKIYIDSSGERKFLIQLEASDVEINNSLINKLISENKASLVTTVFCGSTLFKKSFIGFDKIIIEPNDVGGRILITTTIVALTNFEIDLSNEDTVNKFFQNKVTVGIGKHLSIPIRKSFNHPIIDYGTNSSIFSFKYEDVGEIIIDFGEGDLTASRVKITYPDKDFVSELNLHLKMRKQFPELSTSLFFESILVKMFALIKNAYDEHINVNKGLDHDFYDHINPWMQELLNQYKLLNSDISMNTLDEFETSFNIINRRHQGKLVIADSLKQLNDISETNG